MLTTSLDPTRLFVFYIIIKYCNALRHTATTLKIPFKDNRNVLSKYYDHMLLRAFFSLSYFCSKGINYRNAQHQRMRQSTSYETILRLLSRLEF